MLKLLPQKEEAIFALVFKRDLFCALLRQTSLLHFTRMCCDVYGLTSGRAYSVEQKVFEIISEQRKRMDPFCFA